MKTGSRFFCHRSSLSRVSTRVLRAQGVGGDQISVVSYGEERPAQLGSNESAWTENRRVEIVYP